MMGPEQRGWKGRPGGEWHGGLGHAGVMDAGCSVWLGLVTMCARARVREPTEALAYAFHVRNAMAGLSGPGRSGGGEDGVLTVGGGVERLAVQGRGGAVANRWPCSADSHRRCSGTARCSSPAM